MKPVIVMVLALISTIFLIAAGCEKSTTAGEVVKTTEEEQLTEKPVEEPECTKEEDCAALEICEDNECKEVECKAESDCGVLELCENNECREVECKTDENCDKGFECIDNGCSEKEPEVYDIEIIDLKFLPTGVTVTVGTVVRWTNKDYFYQNKTRHMVAAYDGTFRSGILNWMDSYSYTFTEEDIGEHEYFDVMFKDNMKTPRGKITVTGQISMP